MNELPPNQFSRIMPEDVKAALTIFAVSYLIKIALILVPLFTSDKKQHVILLGVFFIILFVEAYIIFQLVMGDDRARKAYVDSTIGRLGCLVWPGIIFIQMASLLSLRQYWQRGFSWTFARFGSFTKMIPIYFFQKSGNCKFQRIYR